MSTSFVLNLIKSNPALNTALIILITLTLWYIFTCMKSPKNLPPGPRGLPYFGYLPFLGSKPHRTLTELRKKYGDMFRIYIGGELVIVLSSFRLIKDALIKPVFDERPAPMRAFATFGPEAGVFSGYGATRVELHRFVLSMLRNFGVGKTSLEPQIQGEINCLIEEIAKLKGQPADLRNLLSLSACNAVVSILYGERMKYDEPAFQELLYYSKAYLTSVGLNQWSDHLPQFLINLLRIKTPQYSGALLYKRVLEQFQIYEKSKNTNNPENFIDSWRSKAKISSANKAIYTEERLAQVVSELIIAGSDTTSTTLEWALLYLIEHPQVQERVQMEIDSVIGKERTPTMSDQKLMTYTQATVMEVSRISSIAPLSDPRSASEDTLFNGYSIPKDATILTNLWALHRDPEIFPQPEQFLPERFLSEDNTVKRVKELIPFSLGRRQCPGEALARMQLFLYLTSLLQHFTFKKHNDVVLDYQSASVLEPVHQEICAVLRQ